MKTIKIKCEAADSVPMDQLLAFQGELKKLKPENRNKLETSILNNGFIAPIFVWKNKEKNMILDGHQRLATLKYMQEKGHTIPDLPVAYIEAETVDDAREKLLHIASQYGEFDTKVLDSWLQEIDGDMINSVRLVEKEIDLFKKDEKKDHPECEFTEELMESHNYVVLYFDNDIDWQTAIDKLNIKSVKTADSRKGYERKGIGRVLRGDEVIKRIQD